MSNLNQFGGACRCLLRLRENDGKPGLSDEGFIAAHLDRFPQWTERPGESDTGMVFELARELGLADRVEIFRGYDHVLAQHRAGHGIIVVTERAPQQGTDSHILRRYTMLVVAMDEDGFTLWCPYPSGLEDTFPKLKRALWEEWQSIGIVLQRGAVPVAIVPSPVVADGVH